MLSLELEIAYKNATNAKTNIESKYDDIAQYTMPYFSMWETENNIEVQTNDINSFILRAVNTHINFLTTNLLAGGEYATLELDKSLYEREDDITSQKILKSFDDLNNSAKDDGKKITQVLDGSNFTTEAVKALYESENLGTGCLKAIINTKSDVNPVKFKHISVRHFSYTEDHDGIDCIFIKLPKMTVKKLRMLLNDNSINVEGSNKPEDLVIVREVVHKNDQGKWEVNLYDCDFHLIKKLQVLDFCPYMIFKSGIFTNSPWGKGKGFDLMDTFRRLNYYNKLQRTSAEHNVFPSSTYFGDPNHFDKLSMNPGSMSYGGATREAFDIVFNPVTGNYQSLSDEIQKAENEVAEVYQSQPLGQYADRGQITATEVSARMNMYRQSNAISYELISEGLLKPVFFAVYNILQKKELVSLDLELIEMINIRYINALSKSKDREKANELIQYKQTMLQTAPQTELTQIDQLKYGEILGGLLDIDHEVYKTTDEMQENVNTITQNYVNNSTPQANPLPTNTNTGVEPIE